MITVEDLQKIKRVLRSEIEAEGKRIKSYVSSEIKLFKFGVSNNLSSTNDRLKNIEIITSDTQSRIKKLDKRLTKTINFFDNADADTRSKVNKTRKDLGLNEVEFAY